MEAPITVNVDLPSDNADVLNGTLLDPVPGPGVLLVFLASSQRDGIMTVTGKSINGAYRVPPVLRSSGIPDVQSDMPTIVPVPDNQKVVVNYDEVTAGDAFATIMFVGA